MKDKSLDKLETIYNFLVYKKKFKSVKELFLPESFGNILIELSSEDFIVKLSKDRSEYSIEIAHFLDKKREWFDLELILEMIEGESNIIDINLLISFFINYYDIIKEKFNSANFENTKIILNKLEQKRSQDMFPWK